MRIAVFHELQPGGARRVVNEFSKYLRLKGYTVDLYLIDEKEDISERKFHSKVYFYKFVPKLWKGRDWKVRLYKDTFEIFNLYLLHKKIGKEINKRKYDVVIFHPSKFTQSPFVLRFVKTRKVYYAQEIYRIMYEPIFKFRKSEYPLKYIYETVTKFVKKNIDKGNTSKANVILVGSRNTKKGFMKYYGISATVCYPGIDHSFFKPGKIKKDIDVLFIGSLNYETGEYALFKNSLNFVSRNVKVKILGGEDDWISDKKLLNIYRRSKLTICTDIYEPLGLVPLEAASCGVPTLAVNSGGYRETIINGKTGMLVRNNPLEMASAIDKLLNDHKLLNTFGDNARKFVLEKWTWDKSIKNLESVLLDFSNKN